jgi:uridine phosphorylase
MGTPSLEIVINELIILNEIDLETRMPRGTPLHSRLNIIRLGTSGGLQASTKLGTPIISAFAIGLDNTGLFYTPSKFDTASLELAELCKDSIAAAIPTESTFAHKICPYAAAATPEVVRALYEASLEEGVEAKVGITASNAGFFANQGRDIVGIPLSVPDIDEILSRILFHELRVENMEMEASFMFHFVHALNCRASQPDSLKYYVGAVCPAVANRRLDTFDGHYEENILTSLHIILRAFEKLNSPEE